MSINLANLSILKKHLEKYPHANLVAVTKNRTIEDIEQLLKMNIIHFGENRVQEAESKFTKINSFYELHLIGPLQTNKVKQALYLFDVIQSIDRKKLVDTICRIKKIDLKIKTRSFFLQVNIGDEAQKSGISIDELPSLYSYCTHKGLNIDGLMCIPPNQKDPTFFFEKMQMLKKKINSELKLSMGMSQDYEIALKKGADFVRVGSLIFNEN